MKKLLLLPLFVLLIACNQEPSNEFVFSGTLQNAAGVDSIMVYDHLYNPRAIAVREDGSFADTLVVEKANYYSLRVGKKRLTLFVEPGKDVQLNHNLGNKDAKVVFEGQSGQIHQYFMVKDSITKVYAGDLKVLYTKSESDFEQEINTLKKVQLAMSNDLPDTEVIFKTMETEAIGYQHLERKGMYERYHGHFGQKQDYTAPATLTAEIEALDKDNENAAFHYAAYRNLVYSDMSNQVFDNTGSIMPIEKKIVNFVATKNSPTVRDHLIQNSTYFLNAGMDDLNKTYDDFMGLTTNEALRETITTKYNKLQKLAKGKPSPAFDYENYKGGNTALADLKGKYVYVDVWATWCGPCIAEIPSLKKVEHEYEGSNIEFVSISIDEKPDYTTWRGMVAEKELGGSQLMADNAWKSQFVTDYAIEGIPHFVLIDPEGNIVNASAHRPSNPDLGATFEALGVIPKNSLD